MIINWVILAYGCYGAGVGIFHALRNKRLNEVNVALRQALRERDAAGREPERVAFQAGFQVGFQAAQEQEAADVDVSCDCEDCTKERLWAVN